MCLGLKGMSSLSSYVAKLHNHRCLGTTKHGQNVDGWSLSVHSSFSINQSLSHSHSICVLLILGSILLHPSRTLALNGCTICFHYYIIIYCILFFRRELRCISISALRRIDVLPKNPPFTDVFILGNASSLSCAFIMTTAAYKRAAVFQDEHESGWQGNRTLYSNKFSLIERGQNSDGVYSNNRPLVALSKTHLNHIFCCLSILRWTSHTHKAALCFLRWKHLQWIWRRSAACLGAESNPSPIAS